MKNIAKLLTLAACLTLLTACGSKSEEAAAPAESQESVADQVEDTTEEATEEATEDTADESTLDVDNLVVDALNESFDVVVYGETYTVDYRIPEIQIDTEEIKALNQEIYDLYYPYYERTTKEPEAGWNECNGTTYRWYVIDDTLSLMITASLYPDASGWLECKPYAVDLTSLTIMEKEDILAKYDMDEETYRELVRETLGNFYCNLYSDYNDMDEFFSFDFALDQLTRTVSDENVDFAVPYINEIGELAIYARIYSIAGGDYYPYEINISEVAENDAYEDYKAGKWN